MPYKDVKKNSQVSMESAKRLYYPTIPVRFRRGHPESWEAIHKAASDAGVSKTEYVRIAVLEKLVNENYLSSINPPDPE